MNNGAQQKACSSTDCRALSTLAVVLVANDPASDPAQDTTKDGVIVENLGRGDQGRQCQQARSDC